MKKHEESEKKMFVRTDSFCRNIHETEKKFRALWLSKKEEINRALVSSGLDVSDLAIFFPENLSLSPQYQDFMIVIFAAEVEAEKEKENKIKENKVKGSLGLWTLPPDEKFKEYLDRLFFLNSIMAWVGTENDFVAAGESILRPGFENKPLPSSGSGIARSSVDFLMKNLVPIEEFIDKNKNNIPALLHTSPSLTART